MEMVDCRSVHSPLLTAIHNFKYNIILGSNSYIRITDVVYGTIK